MTGARPRLDSLTGLRFVAAFAVFGFHLILGVHTTQFSPLYHVFLSGASGVSFFFVLSGFVLTWSHRSGDTPGAFVRRRLARIYPLHVATWAFTGVIAAILFRLPSKLPALASLLMLSTWVPSVHYYDAMNTPSWSLGCELFFYLLFPLLLPALRSLRSGQRRALLVTIALTVVVIAAACAPAYPTTLRFWVLYQFPPTRLLEFVAGILLALEAIEGSLPRIRLLPAGLLAAGAYVGASYAPNAFGLVAITFVPFLLLIAAAAQSDAAEHRTVFSTPVFVQLGVWSFAFYLVHAQVLTIMRSEASGLAQSPLGAAVFGLVTLALVVLAAALTSTSIEQPLERTLRAPGRRHVRATAEALSPEAG